MNVKFLNSPEKKEIIEKLNENYGISSLPHLFLQIGREKIRAFSGSLTKEEISKIAREANIEIIGMYLAKFEKDGIRLSHDAVTLLADKITKNITDITDEQAKEWMKGNDLAIKMENKYIIIRNKNLLLGCGKSTGERIINFVPKERRVKN